MTTNKGKTKIKLKANVALKCNSSVKNKKSCDFEILQHLSLNNLTNGKKMKTKKRMR